MDTQLDRLRTRDMQLSYNTTTAKMFDMKQRLSKGMSVLEQDTRDLSDFRMSQQCGDLHEKVLKLENELLQMRSTLDKGSTDEPTRVQIPHLFSRTLPETQEDCKKQEKQNVDTELYKLREALREAEARATTHEEERNKALHHLQTSAETQRIMLNQIEEMSKKLSHDVHNRSEVQEQLSEANNKISKACLDKAILSTNVLKLEDSIREIKAKLTEALCDKDHLIQEKEDLLQRVQVLELQLERTRHGSLSCEPNHNLANGESNNVQDQETVLKEDSESLREVNEKLRGELEKIRQSLDISQSQLQELKEERITNSKQITNLEVQNAQLSREKKELMSKINQGGHEVPTETKEKCCQHRESVEVWELEKQKLQDQCLCLEAQVQEKADMLHLQEEEYHKQDVMRVQHIKELKAVASHWTQKWQLAALTLQDTQGQLEEFKKSKSINERESDSLLRAELDACKQELEQERQKTHRYEEKGGESVQAFNKETETDSSESSLLCESPSDSWSHQNKSPQERIQNSEIQRLKQKLTEKEKDLSEREHALRSLERLREMEKTEAQIKISALELKLMKNVSEDCQDDGGLPADVLTADSLRVQLAESRRRADQLQQEKMLAVQKLQTLKQQLYPVNFIKASRAC
ncbi:uncharacterized protein PAE49_008593 [Odontesthes bonariensis]